MTARYPQIAGTGYKVKALIILVGMVPTVVHLVGSFQIILSGGVGKNGSSVAVSRGGAWTGVVVTRMGACFWAGWWRLWGRAGPWCLLANTSDPTNPQPRPSCAAVEAGSLLSWWLLLAGSRPNALHGRFVCADKIAHNYPTVPQRKVPACLSSPVPFSRLPIHGR